MPLCPPFYMFSPLLPVLQDTGACQFSREMTSFSSSGRESFVAKTILFEHSSNTLCISLVCSLRVHFEASRFSPPCRQSRPVSLPRPRVIMEGHGDYKRIAPKTDSGPTVFGESSKTRSSKRRKSSPIPAACQSQFSSFALLHLKTCVNSFAPDCRRRKTKVCTPTLQARRRRGLEWP